MTSDKQRACEDASWEVLMLMNPMNDPPGTPDHMIPALNAMMYNCYNGRLVRNLALSGYTEEQIERLKQPLRQIRSREDSSNHVELFRQFWDDRIEIRDGAYANLKWLDRIRYLIPFATFVLGPKTIRPR
jgi:hypothetical protein